MRRAQAELLAEGRWHDAERRNGKSQRRNGSVDWQFILPVFVSVPGGLGALVGAAAGRSFWA